MEPTIIDKIKETKKTCYFVSPHFDDAVLSAGALMLYLSKFTEVIVINVFTKAGEKPYTMSAKAYLKQCGYNDAKVLYHDRRQEDRAVMKQVVKRSINLGFIDALWRKKERQSIFGNRIPELNHIYPTYKFHVIKGETAKADADTVSQLKKQLLSTIDKKNSIVFCPMGIGSHVDHVMVSEVCELLFPKTIFWSDFPYNERNKSAKSENKYRFTFTKFLKGKLELIQKYETQFKAMFKNGLILKEEIFYTLLTPEQI